MDEFIRNFNAEAMVLDDFFTRPSFSSTSYSGTLVDTDKFDITPKKEYKEQLIRRQEEELKENDRQLENAKKYHENRRKEIQGEITRLKMDGKP